jgi:hypothetical protein
VSARPASRRFVCADCRNPVSADAAICSVCGVILGPGDRLPTESLPPPPPVASCRVTQSAVPPPVTSTPVMRCPGCRAAVNDVNQLVCGNCQTPLVPATDAVKAAVVHLEFEGGVVTVPAGGEAKIGRHGDHGSNILLREHDDVSRVHLKVEVAADGTARIRDSLSTNGSYLDGRKLDQEWHPLRDGAMIRLGPDIKARVRYASGGA